MASYQTLTEDTVKLRVIASYGRPYGEPPAEVLVDTTDPVALVLISEVATTWHVTEGTPGVVQQVIVSATEEGEVAVPATASLVELYGADALGDATSSWLEADTRALVENVEALTGLTVASYHGCSSGASFQMEDADALPEYTYLPDCGREVWPEMAPPDTTVVTDLPACAALAADTAICLYSVSETGLAFGAIGLDSGAACEVQKIPRETGRPVSSMAWVGRDLYGCQDYDLLSRYALNDVEDWEVAYTYCANVISDGSDLLVWMADGVTGTVADTVLRFDGGWPDTCEQRHALVLDDEVTGDATIAVSADRLYSARHAASEVTVFDYPDLAASWTQPLEGYDDWIIALAALDDGRLVVLDPHGTLWVYREDGSLLTKHTIPTTVDGLACAPVP